MPIGTDVVKGRALIEALLANNVEEAVKLINEGAYLDLVVQLGEEWHSALHLATNAGHTAVVKQMLARHADVNIRVNKYYALHFAIAEQHKEIFTALLEAGAAVNAQTGYQCTPLHVAVRTGDVYYVQKLLEKNATPVLQDKDGYTPLHDAIVSVDIVRELLKAQARVNVQDKYGRSVLHMAAERGSIEVVELLLKAGADLTLVDENGDTALHAAVATTQLKDRVRVVNLLIEKGVKVNAKDYDGATALHYAACVDNQEVIVALLEAGADLEATDRAGQTPFYAAICVNQALNVNLLHEFGASVNTRDAQDKTPLHVVCMHAGSKIAHSLLAWGAEVDAVDNEGDTPLHCALASFNRKSWRVTEVLLAKKANVNVKNNDGITPLVRAIRNEKGEWQIARLLDCGANANVIVKVYDPETGEASEIALIAWAVDQIDWRITKKFLECSDLTLSALDVQILKERVPEGSVLQQLLHARFPEHFPKPIAPYVEIKDDYRWLCPSDSDEESVPVAESVLMPKPSLEVAPEPAVPLLSEEPQMISFSQGPILGAEERIIDNSHRDGVLGEQAKAGLRFSVI